MKSVLMIAYWFPPEGNAPVYRPLRFLRNLSSVGWSGRVISSGGTQFERYDHELLIQIPQGTEIIRVADGDLWRTIQRKRSERLGKKMSGASDVAAQETAAQEPASRNTTLRSRCRGLVRKAESWWYHPDMQRSWIRPAVEATLATCTRTRPDVLWATGPPFSAFIVAQRAAQITGIPYVLDFRTSWTIVPSPFEAMRPAWAQQRDRHMLRELLRDAQAVTFFYEAEAECFWRLYRGALNPSRIHIIPNGFEGEVEDFVLPDGDTFTILYTGTLSDYRYETFLDALRIFKQREPCQARRLSVQFVGEGVEDVAGLAKQLNIADIVSTSAPIPHSEIHRLQRSAHALLMFERRPTKGYELLAGAKLFGYLKFGRPILGVVPEGEAARVLRDVGVSTIADPDSPEKICAVVETMLNVWSAGKLCTLVPDRSACERYSGKAQTSALARALEGRPPIKEFVPGAVDIVPSLRAEFAAGGWA
jgi:Glycosyl transferase 4-like domain